MLPDLLRPGVRIVIAGTVRAGRMPARPHYYSGPGNNFYLLLHESGLLAERLSAEDDDRLPGLSIGLTDLVRVFDEMPGRETIITPMVAEFEAKIAAAGPLVVAFVSKTAATTYARAVGERAPRDYGPVPWTVAGRPAFVLPGPSGANNGMPLPLRIGLWRDLTDYLETR